MTTKGEPAMLTNSGISMLSARSTSLGALRSTVQAIFLIFGVDADIRFICLDDRYAAEGLENNLLRGAFEFDRPVGLALGKRNGVKQEKSQQGCCAKKQGLPCHWKWGWVVNG